MERVGPYRLLAREERTALGERWRGLAPGPPEAEVTLELLTGARGLPPEQRRRLAARLRALRQLDHPGLLACLDAGELDGVPYLVQARAPGPSLARRLSERGPLDADTARRLVGALADTLADCHAQAVLHGDVAPGQVYLPHGDPEQAPLLGGFDLALGSGWEPTGESPERLAWRAPERGPGGGPCGHRADVWGLGAVLYAALTGAAPARESTPARPSRLRAGVPGWLDAVCRDALQPDPAARTPDVAAFRGALTPPRPSRGRRVAGALLAGLALALLGGALWRLTRPEALPPPPPPPSGPPAEPAGPSAHALLGRAGARVQTGDLTGALGDLDLAVAQEPDLARAWRERGLVRWRLGDARGALADLDRAIGLEPQDAASYLDRAVARRSLGDTPGAMADLNRAVTLDPQDARAWYNRGNTRYESGDPRGGIEDFDRALALDPLFVDALANRANARSDVGDVPGALEDYGRALELGPMALIHYNRGLLLQQTGDLPAARRDFDRALELAPDMQPAWSERGVNRWLSGDLNGARADYDRALSLRPADARALANRALVFRRQGDLPAALSDLDRAVELEPAFAPARLNRSSLRLQMGDRAGAIEDARRATELLPRDGGAWYALGDLLADGEDLPAARLALRRALDLSPQAEWAGQARARLHQVRARGGD